jgi:hypothetical protein
LPINSLPIDGGRLSIGKTASGIAAMPIGNRKSKIGSPVGAKWIK